MRIPIMASEIRYEHDVVLARQRARQIAALLGFDAQDQTRIATAVSEIARNAFNYAAGGRVEFAYDSEGRESRFSIDIVDQGRGISDVRAILDGRYHSKTGMGMGIVGTRRLMDTFAIDSSPAGTRIAMSKTLARVPATAVVRSIGAQLASLRSESMIDEIREQNQELLRTLDELRRRQDELSRLNRELEDTNRGVVALYAELDEKAEHLLRAGEVKSRFLSNMSHEFRTPLNSILALSQILLGRTDGELSEEQEKQVSYIRKAATDLSELVNDLLDLAKIEAGKTDVRPAEFRVDSLFSALRGSLRPLLVSDSVRFVIEETDALPPMITDEGKVSQILRNFISNSLKFTERGEVRLTATLTDAGRSIAFAVSDTGIGIAPEDHARIFEEFTQVENPLQRRVKGTGLGLPLCKRLIDLLGGSIGLESTPGTGSTFTATVPIVYRARAAQESGAPGEMMTAVIFVSQREEANTYLERALREARYQPVIVRTPEAASLAINDFSPRGVIVEIRAGDDPLIGFISEVAGRSGRPVLVATAQETEARENAKNAGADVVLRAPADPAELVAAIGTTPSQRAEPTVLIIDDDDVSRYLLRRTLPPVRMRVVEADNGEKGIDLAFQIAPDVILLDLVMPGLSGAEVLEKLRSDTRTRGTPVVIVTSQRLDTSEREKLLRHALAVIGKDENEERRAEAIRGALQSAGITV